MVIGLLVIDCDATPPGALMVTSVFASWSGRISGV